MTKESDSMTISQIYTTPPTDERSPVEQATFHLLEKLHIPYERVEHDPADTMEDCREIIETASNLEALGLFPTSMELSYPAHLTTGNKTAKINAVLLPERVHQNVLCLGDYKAVSVTPDGRITVLGAGTSVIHVIPTCNMALFRTIQIKVTAPTVRLVTRTSIRLTSNGNFRLN